LQERLSRAVILPEKLPVVKKILVADLKRVIIPGLEKAAERDVAGLRANVHLALLLPDEVDEALDEFRKKEAGKGKRAEAGGNVSETAKVAESAGGESNRTSRNQ